MGLSRNVRLAAFVSSASMVAGLAFVWTAAPASASTRSKQHHPIKDCTGPVHTHIIGVPSAPVDFTVTCRHLIPRTPYSVTTPNLYILCPGPSRTPALPLTLQADNLGRLSFSIEATGCIPGTWVIDVTNTRTGFNHTVTDHLVL